MNLHYGEIVDLFVDDGLLTGRVRVGAAMKRVPLTLLDEARPGDQILVCDGVAISRVNNQLNTEVCHVSRDPR